MSDLDGNSEDPFCGIAAQIIKQVRDFFITEILNRKLLTKFIYNHKHMPIYKKNCEHDQLWTQQRF